VKARGTGIACLLLASLVSGCVGIGNGDCDLSPVAYSDGNPYECQKGDLWGIGHYCDQYGFLCRHDECADGAPQWD